MELTVPIMSGQDHLVQRMNLRRYMREGVSLRMIAADAAGLVSGQVIDLTTRGCGLRLTPPVGRGKYLTLKIYPENGTAAVQCDLAQVQWVAEERVGVIFLSMSLENELRLRRLCRDRLAFEFWD